MNNIEESIKLAKETRWAVLGRTLADAASQGKPVTAHIAEAELLRRQEQDSADRETQFAALARQVGDAVRKGKDTQPLVAQLVALRRRELGHPIRHA